MVAIGIAALTFYFCAALTGVAWLGVAAIEEMIVTLAGLIAQAVPNVKEPELKGIRTLKAVLRILTWVFTGLGTIAGIAVTISGILHIKF